MKTKKQILEEIQKSYKLTEFFASVKSLKVGRIRTQLAIRFALQWALDNKYDKSIVEYMDESLR